MPSRERPVQDELYRIISNIVKDRRFASLTLSVRTEFPISGRSADVAVLKHPEDVPILIIETKRKVERWGYYKREELFDPYGRAVVGQALSYAALAKEQHNLPTTPAFATANRDVMVLFSPVKDPWRYLDRSAVERRDYENALSSSAYVSLIHEHYLLDDKNPLREELLQHVLDQVSRVWQREVSPEQVRSSVGDWLLGKLRWFVDSLSSYYVEDVLRARLTQDGKFGADLNALAVKAGYRNGLADIVGADYSRVNVLARMMVYVLMNKIIFYKVLERNYKLPELKPILEERPEISSGDYLKVLSGFFDEALKVTGDFEQIFFTGLFDHVVLSEERGGLYEVDELIRLLSVIEVERLGDIIGYIYEDLIPAEERHQMGQFYTPKPIAELIAKWCIRGPDDVVLGPGCGSGTFEVEAYWRLAELKTGKGRGIPPGREVHKIILRQIYALDINPFPTQLTAMNLAMKNVRAPTTEANIITTDFFAVMPGQKLIAPYPVMTPSGPKYKEIFFPGERFDVVMGNPPYTRWTEIIDSTQDMIKDRLGDLLTKYGLHADVARGKEPGIYVHFIMWSHEFLKPGGRLGMIISDSWLQTDYGVNFGRFLLENYKVKALIDISARVFPVPLIGTCIVLLEKPREGEDVNDNDVIFMYLHIPKEHSFNVDEILSVIKNPANAPQYYKIRVMKQKDVPRDQKWISLVFKPEEILDELKQKTIKMNELFEPSRGNYAYAIWALTHGKRPDTGANEFFYLRPSEVIQWDIKDYVIPSLKTPRYAKFFTFSETDWEKLKEQDKECYVFMAHKPFDELSEEAKEYIRWGETECITRIPGTRGGGKKCYEALACQERAKPANRKWFYGWYDLGGVMYAPIFVPYYARYKHRFQLALMDVMLDADFIAFIPKNDRTFSSEQLKALCAYLNSSFIQLYIEAIGRVPGAVGPIALEAKQAREIPVIDIGSLDEGALKGLASLFDELERKARELEGADKYENIMKLQDAVIAEIDRKIAEILDLPEVLADMARQLAKAMMERRLARAEEARPTALKGIEDSSIVSKEKRTKERRKQAEGESAGAKRLTDFI